MSANLVTVATYMTATEAYFAVNRLKDAGIEAVVNDEHMVTTDYLLGNAFGWIKVQVREPDAERADDVLSAAAPPVNEEDIPWDQPPEDEEDAGDELTPEERARKIEERAGPNEPEAPKSEAEQAVDRAYKIAIMGLVLLPPLPHFYSLYLLTKLSSAPELPRRASVRYFYTFVIDLIAILGFIPLWLIFI